MPDIQINTKEESVYSLSYLGCNIFGMPFIPYEQSLAAVTSVWLLYFLIVCADLLVKHMSPLIT